MRKQALNNNEKASSNISFKSMEENFRAVDRNCGLRISQVQNNFSQEKVEELAEKLSNPKYFARLMKNPTSPETVGFFKEFSSPALAKKVVQTVIAKVKASNDPDKKETISFLQSAVHALEGMSKKPVYVMGFTGNNGLNQEFGKVLGNAGKRGIADAIGQSTGDKFGVDDPRLVEHISGTMKQGLDGLEQLTGINIPVDKAGFVSKAIPVCSKILNAHDDAKTAMKLGDGAYDVIKGVAQKDKELVKQGAKTWVDGVNDVVDESIAMTLGYTGAEYGTMIWPGVGTVVGAVGGYLVGKYAINNFVKGGKKDE